MEKFETFLDQVKKIQLPNLNNFCLEKGDFYYTIEDTDFYFKNNKGKNLVVFFHGSVPKDNPNKISFRGYNYNFENTDILCLSDRLLKIYSSDNLQLSWYLSTPKYDNFNLYKKVLDKILSNNYNKIIFTGTSGGGYPALIFSAFYQSICLISNSQIYLHKYPYFSKMLSILNINPKNLFECDIEKFMLTYGFPKQIVLYTNTRDSSHYQNHSLPFLNFINTHKNNIIYPIFFYGDDPPPGRTHHHIQIPNIIYPKAILQILK